MINIKFKVIIILILLFTSLSLFSSRGSIDGDNLVITEVFYDTIGCDTDCEWVEIYNPTSRTIKLNGWFLADNTGSNPLPNFSVAAGGYFIFARNGTQFNSNYGFLPDDDSMTRSLGNAGDQLSLINDNGTVVDFVAWEGGVSGAYPSWTVSAVDKSIRRKMDTNFKPIDTDSNNDWENSGTTGDPNSGYGGTGDTESPVVTITNPTSTVVAGTLSIGCSATDNSGSTTTYEIKIDGISKSNSSTYSWDTSLYNDGSHIIKCEVNDSSSNLGFEEKVVVVDNSPTSDLIKVYFNDPLAGVPQMANPSAQAGNLSLGLTTLLDSANSTIYASLYHIGWEPVIDSLIAAYNRSVTVKLAVDLESIDDFQSLIDAGISVTGVNASSYIMHNKFYVVDGEYVFTGSWNPTVTGTIFNANDGIQIKSIEVANAYTAEFNQLFAGIKGKSKIDNNDEIMKAGSITVEVYFAPKDTGRDRLIELIDSANTSIHLSLFYFTDNNIFAAIERAKNRSVTIKGVFDLRGWENSGSESDDVIAWGFGIVDALPGVNHHKFGVIDGKIVWTGSTNWSAAGFEDNDENSVVVHSTRVAAAYIQRTEELYDDASSYDASTTAAPRIVTKHYKPSTGSNLITWRPRMNGNMASPTVEKYLVWRWNTTLNTFELLAELNWAYGYYYDSNISYNTTYYYCVSSVAFDGTESGCSAEYAQIKYTATSGSQPTLYPASGHLSNFATETTNPVVSIQNPTNTETVSGFVDITFTADDKSYINTWEVYINGILKTSDSHYQWDSTAIADGSYTIMAKARDTAGNWGQHSITVSVDNSAYLPPMSPSLNTFKFATYNIENSGLNPNYINVLKEENPDVFVLVETGLMEDNGNASLNVLLVELNEYFNNEVPYQFVTTIGQPYGTTGLAIFSRFEILNALLIPIVTLDSGLNFDVSHDFLSAEIAIGNNSIFVIGSHLKALPNSSNELKRELAQEGILNYMDSLGTSTNIIYAGDLNSYSPVDIGSLAPTNPTLGYGPVNMTLNGNHTEVLLIILILMCIDIYIQVP
ncbi:MAG: phospholipase D-like domain-containing protein [Candidatus Heimdallarchaeota archaeon]|nr:phospholipase D-like domain-containing protein [Candidatus Heimdallarchaeota archaeon]